MPVSKQRSPRDLSIDELRWLLVEKRRHARQARLEQYRRNGRIVPLASNQVNPSLESWQSEIQADSAEQSRGPSVGKRILDGFLLLIEIGAVIGFVYVLYSGMNVLKELNREVVSVITQPTLTPTPLIKTVILPSGHTPPNSPGGARFNEGEIPEHLRPLVQSLLEARLPTPSPAQAVRLQVPAIKVDAPIVQGDGWDQLKKGVGQHPGTVNPGDKGNLVLSAHNDIFGEIFRDLDRLNPGDLVIVFTNQRSYTYIVIETKLVEPTAVEVLDQTVQPTVTLISCYPYLKDNKRIIVTARLQTSG